jgi:hypothetical protein
MPIALLESGSACFMAAIRQAQMGKWARLFQNRRDGIEEERVDQVSLGVVPALTGSSRPAGGSPTRSDLSGLGEVLVYEAAE